MIYKDSHTHKILVDIVPYLLTPKLLRMKPITSARKSSPPRMRSLDVNALEAEDEKAEQEEVAEAPYSAAWAREYT